MEGELKILRCAIKIETIGKGGIHGVWKEGFIAKLTGPEIPISPRR